MKMNTPIWLRIALAATAGPLISASALGAATADGPLTMAGITLYGTLDVGVQYQSAGAPLSDYWNGGGANEAIQKNSVGSQTNVAGSYLGQTKIGLKGQEDFGNGWSGVFRLESLINPWSGQLPDGLKSLTVNNGVALGSQTTGIDSSVAGQVFGGAAYAGVSHAQWGTLTVGRQNGVLADGIAKYDPMNASNAFSLIGWSGTAAGGGDTENRRLDNSVKYEVTAHGAHVAAMYQGKSGSNPGTAQQLALGWVFPGGSVDAYYAKKNDAIAAGSLTAAGAKSNSGVYDVTQACAAGSGQYVDGLSNATYTCASIDKAVTGTISDNTTVGLMAQYTLNKQWKLSGGYERIDYKNPSKVVLAGQHTIGGYTLVTVNAQTGAKSSFLNTKTLDVGWLGAKYSPNTHLDVIGAVYGYHQNNYGSAANSGWTSGCSGTGSATCSGKESVVSLAAVYHFTKRFDGYTGAMWSQVQGGLANGFTYNTSTIDPTVGVRYTF